MILTPVDQTGDSEATRAFYRALEIDVLARTLWGEARGEGLRGLEGVAAVVLNRVNVAERHGGRFWWGNTIIQVCQKPYQFSCWNRSDPSYRKLIAVGQDNAHFRAAMNVAKRACDGALPDPTFGATHYHADYVAPHWAKGQTPTAIIGHHIFYRL